MTSKPRIFGRRALLRQVGAAATTAAAAGLLGRGGIGHAQDADTEALRAVPDSERKLLFVFAAYGGASILDSFMPVLDTDLSDPFTAAGFNTFPAAMVEQKPGSNIRNVGTLADYALYKPPTFTMGDFVARHGADMAVVAHDASSVNHTVGQQRSLNGAGVNRGRTLMEAMALRYGGGLALPNMNMATEGFIRDGADQRVPLAARHELIASPLLFGAATHGRVATGAKLDEASFARARMARDQLDRASAFGRTFARDARLSSYLRAREERVPEIEKRALINRLLLLDTSRADPRFGVQPEPITELVRQTLPSIGEDPLQAQIGLAFLAAYHGVCTSATVGYRTEPHLNDAGQLTSAPIAFDFSHGTHRTVQNVMWNRTVTLLDALITLLKTHDYLGDPRLGRMWDRSLIYVATEFGRDKVRPAFANEWGTGHALNNGSLLISPLLKGNRVYGGIDPATCMTFGCDPETGDPAPGTHLSTADIYGIIAQALDLDSPSTRRFPGIVRG